MKQHRPEYYLKHELKWWDARSIEEMPMFILQVFDDSHIVHVVQKYVMNGFISTYGKINLFNFGKFLPASKDMYLGYLENEDNQQILFNNGIITEFQNNNKKGFTDLNIESANTPLNEQAKEIIQSAFDENDYFVIVKMVNLNFEKKTLEFDVYDPDRDGTFENNLKINPDGTIKGCMHEIWEGEDVEREIIKRVSQIIKQHIKK